MTERVTQRVTVVTDSTADLPPELAVSLGIEVVPLFVIFGDERFRDGVELLRSDFFRRLAAGGPLPTTSQPTAAMFEQRFAPHVQAGREIVSIHIMLRLSGTINAARAGASAFPGAPIHLIDSGNVSGGHGLLVLRAAELARAGAGAAEIVAEIEAAKLRQRGYVAFPDYTNAVRSGRISRVQAAIGGLLKIVPVLRLGNGEVETEARVRTFERAQETLVTATLAYLGANLAGARIGVVNVNAPEQGRALIERLRARLSAQPLSLLSFDAGPAIACHTGSGSVGIFSIAG
ncbi:MAG: DegV family protein [Candidatus Baltobacteraceae bacterium]